MQTTRTCKPYISDQVAVMKGLAKRTGIPAVMFDGDMGDERFYAQAEVDSRIETLMALLAGAKDK